MTPLIAFWLLSLVALVGIVFYARRANGAIDVVSGDTPTNWGDFIAIELTRMVGYILHLVTHARPHGERVVAHGTVFLKKGHDAFVEKIFGGIEVEKGKAASFFLKRIAEQKEALKQRSQKGRKGM